MYWVMASVVVAFCGLLVLAYCAFRVFAAVRGLAAEVDAVTRRLRPRQAALREELDTLRQTK